MALSSKITWNKGQAFRKKERMSIYGNPPFLEAIKEHFTKIDGKLREVNIMFLEQTMCHRGSFFPVDNVGDVLEGL